jgi:hypothetical protein|nr:MAG TPA: hypothetical protein [Caudoviricetes sp.]
MFYMIYGENLSIVNNGQSAEKVPKLYYNMVNSQRLPYLHEELMIV